jgi:glycosyltransferase involved in cell wall biosynthesis
VINQVAGPLMVELLSDLRDRGVLCRILTGQIEADDAQLTGIDVLPGRRLDKQGTVRRMWTWGRFSLQAMRTMVRHRREPVLVVTNPPLVMLAMPLLARLFGVRYALLIYDVYPDVMERMGLMRPGGLAARIWRRLSRRSLLQARAVITIGRQMAQTLRGHLRKTDACEIRVIPTWVDTEFIRPLDKAQNPFVRQHGLEGRFVVLYSGSFGATHDIESIVEAAGLLTDLLDVRILLIGGGTRWQELTDLVAARQLPNLTLLPFQPREVLPFSLAAADCQIVALDEAYAGISVPSKTYYALAAGSALLAISPPGTELVELVEESGCGLHVRPRDAGALAGAIRQLRQDAALLADMRRRGRQTAERGYDRKAAVAGFLRIVAERFGER